METNNVGEDLFVHEPLKDASEEIRLLRIDSSGNERFACTLVHVVLADAPPYEAISYVWGSQETPKTIYLSGKPFLIGQNCLLALRQAATHQTEPYLWIDAICINQQDGAEKGKQVWNMSRIFDGAKQVLASIMGDGTLESSIARSLGDICRNVSSFSDWEFDSVLDNDRRIMNYFDTLPTEILSEILHSLVALGEAEYFTRLWTVPELLLAKSVLFCVEGVGLRDSHLKTIIRIVLNCEMRPPRPGSLSTLAHGPLHNLASTLRKTQLRDLTQVPNSYSFVDFVQTLERFWDRKCKNPRDRIYALLPLVNKSRALAFIPDYNATSAEAALQVLECYGTRLFGLSGLGSRQFGSHPFHFWKTLWILVRALDVEGSEIRALQKQRNLSSPKPSVYIEWWASSAYRLSKGFFGRPKDSQHSIFTDLGLSGFPLAWTKAEQRPWAACCHNATAGDFVIALRPSDTRPLSPALVIRASKSRYTIVGMAVITNWVCGWVRRDSELECYRPWSCNLFLDPLDLLLIGRNSCPNTEGDSTQSYTQSSIEEMLSISVKSELSYVECYFHQKLEGEEWAGSDGGDTLGFHGP